MGLTSKPKLDDAADRVAPVGGGDCGSVAERDETRGLTAATALTSATWSAGSSIVVRSRPSAS